MNGHIAAHTLRFPLAQILSNRGFKRTLLMDRIVVKTVPTKKRLNKLVPRQMNSKHRTLFRFPQKRMNRDNLDTEKNITQLFSFSLFLFPPGLSSSSFFFLQIPLITRTHREIQTTQPRLCTGQLIIIRARANKSRFTVNGIAVQLNRHSACAYMDVAQRQRTNKWLYFVVYTTISGLSLLSQLVTVDVET